MTLINRYSVIAIATAALSACSEDVLDGVASTYLDGEAKTPIEVRALLDADHSAQTRAVDKAFEKDDQIVAYLRHVTWTGKTPATADYAPAEDAPKLVSADKSPLLVTFTKGSEAMTDYTTEIYPFGLGGNVGLGITASPANTQQTADLQSSPALYWDDFSTGAKGDATDLRTEGHYLESYYGYCYNGGTPTTALAEATGVLGWTVSAAQDEVPTAPAKSNFQQSDLLWSCEQTPVPYAHVDGEGNRKHGTLILPFTHAMSKVTIEIVLDEGYDQNTDGTAKAFGSDASNRLVTTPTLYANRVTTVTAPTYEHLTTVATGDDAKITMRLSDDEATNKMHRVYEAVIAPTVMKADQLLAQVTVDGNEYDIVLTDAVLTTIPEGKTAAWSQQLKGYATADGKVAKSKPETAYATDTGGITLAGVNYRIKVTLRKQKIDVTAYITDWEDVNAEIEGKIMFKTDVKTSEVAAGTAAVTGGSFDLWRATSNTDDSSYDADGTTTGVIDHASTFTLTDGKWEGAPALYWINGTQPYYFRALAKVENPATAPTVITAVSGSTAATQGTDHVWAQTSKHTATSASGSSKDIDAGAAIDPRTTAVPLTFEHVMSKISVQLVDASASSALPTGVDATDYDNPKNPRLNLVGATISIVNLYNGGTISVKDGSIAPSSLTATYDPETDEPYTIRDKVVDSEFKWNDNIVVPQSLISDRAGKARTSTPTFYNSLELTAIYEDGTSKGTGAATTYLTSDLEYVPAVFYSNDDLDAIHTHNAGLTGSKRAGDERVPARQKGFFTYEEFKAERLHQNITEAQYDGLYLEAKLKTPAVLYTLDEYRALKPHESISETEFNALPDEDKTKEPAHTYTQAEIDAAWEIVHASDYVPGTDPEAEETALKTEGETKPAVLYTLDEYRNLQPYKDTTSAEFDALPDSQKTKTSAVYYTYEEYHNLAEIPEALFNALPEDLVVKPAENHTEETANAYNATLDGAWHVGDVKEEAYYKLPTTLPSPTPHNAGDLKSNGSAENPAKVMLYVTLADGTVYSIDLATCRDSSSTLIDEWKRGRHYKYIITLQKEKVTLRALIKEWTEVKGGGKATLEWD